MFRKKIISVLAVLLLVAMFLNLAGCGTASGGNTPAAGGNASTSSGNAPASTEQSKPATITVTDMAGRTVTLPSEIKKVVTLGSVAVLNALILGLGKEETIANSLPPNFRTGRWKYQILFAPHMMEKPMVGDQKGTNVEEVLKVKPDVVLAMDKANVDLMEQNGINAIYLSWTQPEDVKICMELLGTIFDEKVRAEEYVKYFDSTIKKVSDVAAQIPQDQKKTALYMTAALTQPHKIADWWITTAGGISPTDNGRKEEVFQFSPEDLLKWNPDVIIVATPKDLKDISEDARYANIKAVKNKQMFVAPMGIHTWANRGIETPMTVLWMATVMYPEKFSNLEIAKESKAFYDKFFNYKVTEDEVKEILSGDIK